METSEQLSDLAAALSQAQGEMEAAAKDTNNTFFKSKYATLAAVREAVRNPLARNGLAVCQTLSTSENGVRVTSLLLHSSGQWIRDSLDVPVGKFDAQGVGSASTYGLRYSLQAITGIAPDDASDDDGNHATRPSGVESEPAKQPAKKPPKQQQGDLHPPEPAPLPLTTKDIEDANELIAELKKCDTPEMLATHAEAFKKLSKAAKALVSQHTAAAKERVAAKLKEAAEVAA